jgi:hypothetical protein
MFSTIPLTPQTKDFYQKAYAWDKRFPYWATLPTGKVNVELIDLGPKGQFGRAVALKTGDTTAIGFASEQGRDLFVTVYGANRAKL